MELNIDKVEIDEGKVLKFMGYGGKNPRAIISKKIKEEIEESRNLIVPRVFLKKFKIDGMAENRVIFGDKYEIESKYVAEELKDASYIYIALYTVGNSIEEKISEYSNSGEMIRGMILDKVGVVSLDYINEKIREKIEGEVGSFNISAELYPSQRDFDISNQRLIFSLLQIGDSAVKINEYNQFSPIKTVAVIFGIGEKSVDYSMCERCDNRCI